MTYSLINHRHRPVTDHRKDGSHCGWRTVRANASRRLFDSALSQGGREGEVQRPVARLENNSDEHDTNMFTEMR